MKILCSRFHATLHIKSKNYCSLYSIIFNACIIGLFLSSLTIQPSVAFRGSTTTSSIIRSVELYQKSGTFFKLWSSKQNYKAGQQAVESANDDGELGAASKTDRLCNSRRFFMKECSTKSMSTVLVGAISGILFMGNSDHDTAAFALDENDSSLPSSSSSLPEAASSSSPPQIIKLISGVQYADVRVGQGSPIKNSDTILLHLKALLYDGSVLFDTRLDGDGRPLLHELGTVPEYNFFSSSSSSSSGIIGNLLGSSISNPKRSKVTLGVEDAILSRGVGSSWQGDLINGKTNPMNQGGIRKVVVPAPLAYGNAGVSRYDAMQMNLRKPVPRDEIIRYEIEVLRCQDIEIQVFTNDETAESDTAADEDTPTVVAVRSRTVQACCPEDVFPCQTNN